VYFTARRLDPPGVNVSDRDSPWKFTQALLPDVMSAHWLSIPKLRGPFTEQQLDCGVPARAWKTMS